MKPKTETESTNIRHSTAAPDCIDHERLAAALADALETYHTIVADNLLKRLALDNLATRVEEIDIEIVEALKKIDKPDYPRMQTIEDVNDYLENHRSPRHRVELLQSVRDELVRQLSQARVEYGYGVDLEHSTKRDAWGILAKILFKPIQDDFNRLIVALSYGNLSLLPFALSMSEGCRGALDKELIESYGMPE